MPLKFFFCDRCRPRLSRWRIALAAVVAIMVKTMAVVILVLHLPAEIASNTWRMRRTRRDYLGAIAAYMFNHFCRIKLPEYLG